MPTAAGQPTRTTSTNPLSELRVKRDERFFFGGRTRSGKSTLADRLIRLFGYRTVVIDPKHTWRKPGYLPVTHYNPTPTLLRQVFRPRDTAASDWADLVAFLTDVWQYDLPTVVYVDELTSVTTPRTAPSVLSTLVRLGGERGFGTWYASQRPKDVPGLFFTEAEHWAVFDLLTQDDRDKVAGYMGDSVRARFKEPYAFWYYYPTMTDPILVHQGDGKT